VSCSDWLIGVNIPVMMQSNKININCEYDCFCEGNDVLYTWVLW